MSEDTTNPPTEPIDESSSDALSSAPAPAVEAPPALVEPGTGRDEPADLEGIDDVDFAAVGARQHAAGAATGIDDGGRSGYNSDGSHAPAEPAPPIMAPPSSEPQSTAQPAPQLVAQQPQVVYVAPPTPPRPAHNRLFGVGLVLVSSIVFTILYGAVSALLFALQTTPDTFMKQYLLFVSNPGFLVPIGAYVIFGVIFAIVANRTQALGHIVTSLLVGVLVYVGTLTFVLVRNQFWAMPPNTLRIVAGSLFSSPFYIVAGLLARECALWFGLAQARRGRKVRARNADALAAFEAEQAAGPAVLDAR